MQAAADVLRSGQVNQWTGPEVDRFEAEACRRFETRHALALSNGTVALELAMKALGVGPGDEVVVPARTFIATAAGAALQGARPVCADVDPDSGGITPSTIAAAITPRTKAIVPVHLGGWPCDMPAIHDLAQRHKVPIVEDCAQAHGARIGGRPVGSWSALAAYSFCQDKIISTGGEGGMVTTSDEGAADFVWTGRDHGKDRHDALRKDHPPGFRWLHRDFGTNGRMTAPQAAIGRVQLGKLTAWVEARRTNAAHLRRLLDEVPGLRVPRPARGVEEAPYRVYAFLEDGQGRHHQAVLAGLARRGVPGGVGSCGEIYRERAFVSRGWAPQDRLPVAARLAAGSLAFPVHPGLEPAHLEWMAEQVRDSVAEASRAA